MADLLYLRVLEVLDRYPSERVNSNGVPQKFYRIRLSCEGGRIDVLDDPSIDAPVGWSGIARVQAFPRTIQQPRKDGTFYEIVVFTAYKLESFQKGYQLPKLSQIKPN